MAQARGVRTGIRTIVLAALSSAAVVGAPFAAGTAHAASVGLALTIDTAPGECCAEQVTGRA